MTPMHIKLMKNEIWLISLLCFSLHYTKISSMDIKNQVNLIQKKVDQYGINNNIEADIRCLLNKQNPDSDRYKRALNRIFHPSMSHNVSQNNQVYTQVSAMINNICNEKIQIESIDPITLNLLKKANKIHEQAEQYHAFYNFYWQIALLQYTKNLYHQEIIFGLSKTLYTIYGHISKKLFPQELPNNPYEQAFLNIKRYNKEANDIILSNNCSTNILNQAIQIEYNNAKQKLNKYLNRNNN